jgi:hypothetical protein
MLADFTELSRQLFVEAFSKETEDGFHAAYEGKPLSMLTLTVPTLYSPKSETRLVSERLIIEPLNEQHISMMEFCERPPDGDILTLRSQKATAIGNTALHPGIVIGDVLHPGSIVADYEVSFTSGRVKQVDTLTDRPAKMTIAGALSAAEEGLKYVRSGGSDDDRPSVLMELIRLANRRSKYSDRPLPKHTWFQFDLQMHPDLPLNGEENVGFLRRYYGTMRESIMSQTENLERFKSMNHPLSDKMAENITRYEAAKARAKKILEDLGEKT